MVNPRCTAQPLAWPLQNLSKKPAGPHVKRSCDAGDSLRPYFAEMGNWWSGVLVDVVDLRGSLQ
jgi:hypothetical protein